MENKGDPVRAYVYPCNESGSIVEFGDKEWIMCVECDEEQDEEYGPSPIDPKRAIRNSELTNEDPICDQCASLIEFRPLS